MVFDDEQKQRDDGGSSPDQDEKRDERRGSGAAAAAGAGGAGLGAGAAAGIVGGDDLVEAVRDRLGDEGDGDQVDLEDVQSRIEAAQEAARAATRTASIDVFESQANDVADALPADIAAAANIIGDALPPMPVADDAEAPAESNTQDGPPTSVPPIGRPQQEPGDESETEAPEAPEAEGDEVAPAPPAAPGAPTPPGSSEAPAPPAFPGAPGPESDDDAVVSEAPGAPPGPSAPAPEPGAGDSDDVVAESPVVDGTPAPPAPEAIEDDEVPPVSAEPGAPGSSDDAAPTPEAPSGPGTSEEREPPVSSEPSTPDTPSSPPPSGGSDAPSAPTTPGGPDTGPPSTPPSGPESGPSPGGEPGTSVDYPYVYEWDDEGHWVDMALQNDHGDVFYLRYYDDGSVYYLNEHGQYVQVESHNPPHLLYVDDDGVAYFSKVQHHDTVYFSYDTYGDFDWVDYHDIPGYETPPYEDEYEYPRVVEYDESWALIEMEDGRLVKYYSEGGAYWVDEHGNEEAIVGFQTPRLIYVDGQTGYAYFRVFVEAEGEYRFYYIDEDGGVEYVHDYDVPGYVPPYDDYEYPRVIEWNADEGWVIVQGEDGEYAKYFLGGEEDPVDQYGNPIYNGLLPFRGDLVYFDEQGNAWFRDEEDTNTFFMVDHDGGLEYVDYHDIPNYQDLEPPYGGHPPYFFEDYPNPLLLTDPDGEPTFANGVYQQTFNDGQIVMTWTQEGGPYQIRYYSEDNAGGYLQLHLTYDAEAYDYNVHVYPYDYFDHVEEDFELAPIDHYVDFAYLGIPYDNMEISNDYVEYYWYDDDGDLLQKTQVNRHTGEVIYEYDELYIHVDRYGNEYYEGYPDPNWAPPAGYGEVEDYPPYGMPPYLVFGGGYDYEMQYADPDEAGYELLGATPADDPTQWQYIGPNGERVIVSKLDENTYQFVYQSDPNATPGDWEMVMNVTTDEYGNYISYEAVGGDYYDQYDEPVEEYEGDYDPAWAEHYDPMHGFEHPWDLYGEPDPPGENPPPNVYLFGGGRAMLVRNADGSETITWFSESGYQDGYIEYKATVEYEGGQWVTVSDALPIDLIPVYGIWPVEGEQVYDPYHPDVPWGEPDSVTILEDRVIAIWETDEGQIRSEWHRDGSHYREVSYPDGLVISWAGDTWEYTVPDDWTPPDYDGVEPAESVEFEPDGYLPEGSPDYFIDERWPNPEEDPRFEFQYESVEPGIRIYHADLDGDGTYDYMVSVIENADGNVYVDYYNDVDSSFQDNWEARVTITQDVNGNYVDSGITYHLDNPLGAPPYEEPEPEPEDDYLPDWLPESFDGWPSPTQEGFEYQYTGTGDGNQNHFYSNGQYTIMVTDYGDGTGRVLIDDLSNGQGWDMGYDLHDYGQYDVMDAYIPEEPEPAPEDEYLPDWLPESFDGWPSPTQEGFEYQYTGTGGGNQNHFYSNGQYTIMVTDYGDGTGRVLIDDLSNGQGWDTGYDLYDYGQYDVMDAYVPEEPEPEPVDDRLPEWLPAAFGDWPSPTQEGFEYQYTGTGDGNQNHFYSNGQYTIMVTDYGDGTGRVLIDDLSNGQGWDMGYDLHDYGQYAVMDAYAEDTLQTQIAFVDMPDESADEAAPIDGEAVADEEEAAIDFTEKSDEAEAAGEAAADLTFDGSDEGGAQEDGGESEVIEPVEIAQPEIVESEEEFAPVTTTAPEDADLADDDLDDDDGSGL